MEVKLSNIQGAGLGVFATKSIESGAWYGPYKGEKVRADIPMNPGLDTSYMWEVNIFQHLNFIYFIYFLREVI